MLDRKELLQEEILLCFLRICGQKVERHYHGVCSVDLAKKSLQSLHVDPELLSLVAQVRSYDCGLHESIPSKTENIGNEAHRILNFIIHAPERCKLTIPKHHLFSANHPSMIIMRRYFGQIVARIRPNLLPVLLLNLRILLRFLLLDGQCVQVVAAAYLNPEAARFLTFFLRCGLDQLLLRILEVGVLVASCEGKHELRVALFHSSARLGRALVGLVHAQRAAKAENVAHNFVHEGDGHVGQEVKDVDGGPGALTEQVGGIGPLVRSRALHHDAALGHAEAALFVPLLENGDGLFLTLCYASILV